MFTTIANLKEFMKIEPDGPGLVEGGACLFSLFLGSSFYVYVCYPCGIFYVHWVCRVFSGPLD
jgi:hypothetical protein